MGTYDYMSRLHRGDHFPNRGIQDCGLDGGAIHRGIRSRLGIGHGTALSSGMYPCQETWDDRLVLSISYYNWIIDRSDCVVFYGE